jgi:hypothetical protein
MSRLRRKSVRVVVVEGGFVRRLDAVAIAAGLVTTYELVRMLQKGLMYLIQM